jgi:hypothetical protein
MSEPINIADAVAELLGEPLPAWQRAFLASQFDGCTRCVERRPAPQTTEPVPRRGYEPSAAVIDEVLW